MPAFNPALIEDRLNQINERMRAIEAQLAVLSAQAGVPYESPSEGVPPEVVELASAGRKMEAVAGHVRPGIVELAQRPPERGVAGNQREAAG